jgi:hypothetical protein
MGTIVKQKPDGEVKNKRGTGPAPCHPTTQLGVSERIIRPSMGVIGFFLIVKIRQTININQFIFKFAPPWPWLMHFSFFIGGSGVHF